MGTLKRASWILLLTLTSVLNVSAQDLTDISFYPPVLGHARQALRRFHVVEKNKIYRGAQPDESGLLALSELGVKSIVDLNDNDESIDVERKLSEHLGLKFFSRPMSSFFAPNDDEVEQTLSLMADPENQPLFVHCQHGNDRTGVIVALYEIEKLQQPVRKARFEMLQYGFHKILFRLDWYFRSKTGWKGRGETEAR